MHSRRGARITRVFKAGPSPLARVVRYACRWSGLL